MLSRLRGKKPQKPGMTKEQLLSLVPIKNPLVKWDRYSTGEVYLLVPRGKSKRRSLLSKFAEVPSEKKVVFDKVGTYVWELCDGKKTIDEIVGQIAANYKLTRREAEVPTTLHLQRLVKRGYLGLVPKALADTRNPNPEETKKR